MSGTKLFTYHNILPKEHGLNKLSLCQDCKFFDFEKSQCKRNHTPTKSFLGCDNFILPIGKVLPFRRTKA